MKDKFEAVLVGPLEGMKGDWRYYYGKGKFEAVLVCTLKA